VVLDERNDLQQVANETFLTMSLMDRPWFLSGVTQTRQEIGAVDRVDGGPSHERFFDRAAPGFVKQVCEQRRRIERGGRRVACHGRFSRRASSWWAAMRSSTSERSGARLRKRPRTRRACSRVEMTRNLCDFDRPDQPVAGLNVEALP
jgi:hypothetical protein